jgi:hypothetical protein
MVLDVSTDELNLLLSAVSLALDQFYASRPGQQPEVDALLALQRKLMAARTEE